MSLFTSFFVALLGSMLLVPPLIRMSGRLQLMDVPDARKVHEGSIPRSGGIAIVAGALIPILIWYPQAAGFLSLLLGGGVIVVFGLIDDRINLDYRWKFFGQIAAVVIAMKGGLLIDVVPFFGIDSVSPWLSYPLTLLFLLGVTNAINFSDGLDGLAAGTSLLTLSAISWLAYQAGGVGLTLIALALMGGICGFLRYNNYPAIVFMGDAGSQFLGFMTGGLAILLTQQIDTALNPALILLLLGLPILDTLFVMIWRLRRGTSPFLPDRNHFHHRLLEFGFRHYEAVSAIYIAQTGLITLALVVRYQSDLVVVSLYATFALAVLIFFRWAKSSGLMLHAKERSAKAIERRNLLVRRFDWLPHAAARTCEYSIGVFMLAAAIVPIEVDRGLGGLAIAVSATMLLTLMLPAGLRQNLLRIAVYIAGVCAVYSFAALRGAEWAAGWVVNAFVLAMAAALVVAIRLTRREEFRTTPLDLLILVFVLVALFLTEFSEGPFAQYQLGDAVIRLAVVFYGGEFLFSKGRQYYLRLPLMAGAALTIFGLRSFLG